jgi:superfamily II DNA or RNA helicase
MLRRHAQEMLDICSEMSPESPIENIILDSAPGTGKTGAALVAFNSLVHRVVDFFVVVVPRSNLQYQFESDCLDPRFYQGNILRAASNDKNLLRGCDGYITTYQGISANIDLHLSELRGRNFGIIIDETHHLIDEADWGENVYKLIDMARIRIMMTGTFETNNGFIKNINYINGIPDRTNTDKTKWIVYTRQQALNDGVILPIQFAFFDSSGSYMKDEIVTEFDKLGYDKDALRASLKSSAAENILYECGKHWNEYRQSVNKNGKLLTIDSDIATTKRTYEYLKSRGINAEIATSEDNDCHDTIREFKNGPVEALCTCAVAYEGLDVPNISHITLLTHIRGSKSWINQAIARCQRLAPGKDKGYVFAPADAPMLSLVADIQREVAHPAQGRVVDERSRKPNPFASKPKVNPIYTAITGFHIVNDHMTVSMLERKLRKDLDDAICKYLDMKSMADIGLESVKINTATVKRRKLIYDMIRLKINNGRDENGKLMRKHVEEMSIFELQQAISIVLTTR